MRASCVRDRVLRLPPADIASSIVIDLVAVAAVAAVPAMAAMAAASQRLLRRLRIPKTRQNVPGCVCTCTRVYLFLCVRASLCLCVCVCTPTIPRPIGSSVPVSRHQVSSGHAISSPGTHRHRTLLGPAAPLNAGVRRRPKRFFLLVPHDPQEISAPLDGHGSRCQSFVFRCSTITAIVPSPILLNHNLT